MAAAVILRVFVNTFTETYLIVIEKSASATDMSELVRTTSLIIKCCKIIYLNFTYFQTESVGEMHALISAAKPLMTSSCREAIQECRDACGGHGFLKSARLGDLRSTVDPSITYEGDNNVLVQQTSNWLLRQWQLAQTNNSAMSPLGSCDFLKNYESIMRRKYNPKCRIDSNCKLTFIMRLI